MPCRIERGEQHGGRGRAGDAEREHRHQRAVRGGVVGRFGRRHAVERALAEALRMPAEALLDDIGDEGRDRRPGARQQADEEADERRRAGSPCGTRPSPSAVGHMSRNRVLIGSAS